MENLLVVTGVESKANFATVESLSALTAGKIVAIGDGRKIIGSDAAATDLVDVKEIQFVTKLSSTGKLRISVPILRYAITNINHQTYAAGQAQIQKLGGITDTLALNISSQGEVLISVKNLSYNHAISTQRVSVSRTKKTSESPTAFMTALVASLNAAASAQAVPFFTAALINDAGNPATMFGITFTTLSDNVDLAISVGGMFEGSALSVIQAQKVAIGKGSDILAMEKDMQRHLGNSNYAELGDLWYNQPTDAVGATNYDVSTLNWSGVAKTATSARHVANNVLSIATPTAGQLAAIKTLLNVIFGNTYTLTAGAEVPSGPDSDAINNTVS